MHTMIRSKTLLILIFICSQFFLSSNAFSEILKIGNESAKITVKVFSSLTCPHCASFHKEIFENLKKDYIDKNKVKFELRQVNDLFKTRFYLEFFFQLFSSTFFFQITL